MISQWLWILISLLYASKYKIWNMIECYSSFFFYDFTYLITNLLLYCPLPHSAYLRSIMWGCLSGAAWSKWSPCSSPQTECPAQRWRRQMQPEWRIRWMNDWPVEVTIMTKSRESEVGGEGWERGGEGGGGLGKVGIDRLRRPCQ